MMQSLTRDFFPQRCALKEPIKTPDAAGEELRTYALHQGCEAIPCRVGPAGGGERRTDRYAYLDATHRIVLSGMFPFVTEQWIAEVNGQAYEILLVTGDGEGAMTRLETRIIR
jgi:hypothetical protein